VWLRAGGAPDCVLDRRLAQSSEAPHRRGASSASRCGGLDARAARHRAPDAIRLPRRDRRVCEAAQAFGVPILTLDDGLSAPFILSVAPQARSRRTSRYAPNALGPGAGIRASLSVNAGVRTAAFARNRRNPRPERARHADAFTAATCRPLERNRQQTQPNSGSPSAWPPASPQYFPFPTARHGRCAVSFTSARLPHVGKRRSQPPFAAFSAVEPGG